MPLVTNRAMEPENLLHKQFICATKEPYFGGLVYAFVGVAEIAAMCTLPQFAVENSCSHLQE